MFQRSANCWLVLIGIAAHGAGCTTPNSGGNGGNAGGDPLASFRLGRDAAFDAMIATITQADNRMVVCLFPDETRSITDQRTLDLLKVEFSVIESPQGTFDEFVARVSTSEPMKADEICDPQIDSDPDLLGSVARLTAATNRLAACTGADAVTETESLTEVKSEYFLRFQVLPPITAFVDLLADTAEARADQECSN